MLVVVAMMMMMGNKLKKSIRRKCSSREDLCWKIEDKKVFGCGSGSGTQSRAETTPEAPSLILLTDLDGGGRSFDLIRNCL
jgi:hypothetical protein